MSHTYKLNSNAIEEVDSLRRQRNNRVFQNENEKKFKYQSRKNLNPLNHHEVQKRKHA
jgi:hypothetical protein